MTTAVAAVGVACVLRPSIALPWVALTLALLRPDGALLGAGLCVAALLAWKEHRPLLWHGAAAGLVGLSWGVGRWLWFGHWLPLPLLVNERYRERRPPQLSCGIIRSGGTATRAKP